MKTKWFAAIAVLGTGSASAAAGCNESGARPPEPEARVADSAPAPSDDASLAAGQHAGRWVATWTAAPSPPGFAFEPPRTFENQTVRHVVHVSAGGQRVRVRLSNAFGAEPLHVGALHVAAHGGGPAIVPGTDRALTFGGQPSVTIAAGAEALSDPVELKVPSRSDLAVSVYVPGLTGFATYNESGGQTSYVSEPGDFAGATLLPAAATTLSRYWLSVVEVKTPVRVPAVVAFGDSITSGFGSTVDANRRWTDVLSARVNPRFGLPRLAVVNQGVGCNRLLRDECGQRGAARFGRDVLDLTGVTHVVAAHGLTDIIFPDSFGRPDEAVSAGEIIAGLRDLAARAHAEGLTIYGATLTPVGSSVFAGVFTPENEAKRQAVNQWVRSCNEFDGAIDFDEALRDPDRPDRLRAEYDSGDGIHPSDAGYEAMANAVGPRLFW